MNSEFLIFSVFVLIVGLFCYGLHKSINPTPSFKPGDKLKDKRDEFLAEITYEVLKVGKKNYLLKHLTFQYEIELSILYIENYYEKME